MHTPRTSVLQFSKRTLLEPSLSHSAEARLHATPKTEPAAERQALTPREAQILLLIAQGYNSKEIASELTRTKATIETYVRRLMRKLAGRSRCHLIAQGFMAGVLWIDADKRMRVRLFLGKSNNCATRLSVDV